MPSNDDLKISIDVLDARIQELKHTLSTIDSYDRHEGTEDGTDARGGLQTQLNALIEQRATMLRELEGGA